MNDITIKFNKITQDNETWPPEGETVLLSNGDCIIRVGNKARGIGFIANDFISSYIGMSWGNIPICFKPTLIKLKNGSSVIIDVRDSVNSMRGVISKQRDMKMSGEQLDKYRKNMPAVKSRRDVETEIYRKSKTCKCMETTIKWTTITKDESSWPPDREIFLLEVEGISLQFLRVGSYYADESYNYKFIDVIGKQWTPMPHAPL